jgi:hypothetical protein
MKRLLFGLTVSALLTATLAAPAPALASSRKAIVVQGRGTVAGAWWHTSSATQAVDTFVEAVSQTGQPTGLYAEELSDLFDADGNFIGHVETISALPATSGFTYTFDKNRLTSAAVTASGLPATTCSYDATYNLIGCSDTVMDVQVTWTGLDPLERGVFVDHFRSGSFFETDHTIGLARDATASGAINGLGLTAADQTYGRLNASTGGQIIICGGMGC